MQQEQHKQREQREQHEQHEEQHGNALLTKHHRPRRGKGAPRLPRTPCLPRMLLPVEKLPLLQCFDYDLLAAC